jgi:hypothetical protein
VALSLSVGVQAQEKSPDTSSEADRPARVALVPLLAGGVLGLALHEGGHLLLNAVVDGEPGLAKVSFAGIPFFAITHRDDLSPRREYAVSAAGFWVQQAATEWILTRDPDLHSRDASIRKGMIAFDVLASATYSIGAFARIGPAERDTRSMAASRRIAEPWIGALVLAPAVLDSYRYFNPESSWAPWVSRAAKAALVLLILR